MMVACPDTAVFCVLVAVTVMGPVPDPAVRSPPALMLPKSDDHVTVEL